MVGRTTVIYIFVSFHNISNGSSSLKYSGIFSLVMNLLSSIIIDASNSFDFLGVSSEENRNDQSILNKSIVNNNISSIKSLIFEKTFICVSFMLLK